MKVLACTFTKIPKNASAYFRAHTNHQFSSLEVTATNSNVVLPSPSLQDFIIYNRQQESATMDLRTTDLERTITIILEDTGATFTVHKQWICDKSEFVRACLQKGFAAEKQQKVTIHELQDEESMRTVIAWVYAGDKALQWPHNEGFDEQEALTKVYLLADRLMMPQLQNDVIAGYMDAIHNGSNHHLSPAAVQLLHNQDPTMCKLKQCIINWAASQVYHCVFNCNDDEAHVVSNGTAEEACKISEWVQADSDFAQAVLLKITSSPGVGEIPYPGEISEYFQTKDESVTQK